MEATDLDLSRLRELCIGKRRRIEGAYRPPCEDCGGPLDSPAFLQDILEIFGRPVCIHCEKAMVARQKEALRRHLEGR